jgi:hypothetical protein
VHTDQGSQFTSGTWLKELSGMGIGITKSSLIYSQTNRISERVIQTVQEKIRTDCSSDSLKKKTANATKLINQLPTSSTKFTPNEILAIIIKKQTDRGMEENEKLKQVLKNIRSYNNNMSQTKNKKSISKTDLKINSKVLISTKKLIKNAPGIFDERYIGPFVITAKISPDTFCVKLQSGISKTYNI